MTLPKPSVTDLLVRSTQPAPFVIPSDQRESRDLGTIDTVHVKSVRRSLDSTSFRSG